MRIKIGDACEFINGGSWTESDYRDNGLPVLKVSNFNTSGFTINDISYLNFELGNKYEKNKLELNDIIIATVGSHPSLVNSAAGRTIRVNSNVVNYYLNQNAICLRVKEYEIIDQIYLYYLTETTAFRNFIQQRGKGAANQMRIPISGIKDFSWDFPPLETQKKIASILSGYDDLIENNLKRIKILEEMAQQTYEEWFVRMRFPGHESVTMNPETGLPEGWEKKKINDVADFSNGYAFYTKGYSDEETCYKVIDLGNIAENSDLKISGKEKCISEDLYLSSSKFYLNKNDIIIAMTDVTPALGILAKSAIINASNTYVLNQRVGRIRCEKEIDYSYVYAILNDRRFIERMKSLTKGAVQFYFNTKDICNYEFVIPDNEILKKFVSIYQPFLVLRDSLKAQNQRLREARDILLPRLMMGMVEV